MNVECTHGGTSRLGKVKTEQIKRVAKELITRFPSEFSSDFKKNKRAVDTLTEGTTVKVRNKIAGYITHVFSGTQTESSNESEVNEAKPRSDKETQSK